MIPKRRKRNVAGSKESHPSGGDGSYKEFDETKQNPSSSSDQPSPPTARDDDQYGGKDLFFPADVFRKFLEFSPFRVVHNAIGGASRELRALANQVDDTPWPDTILVTDRNELPSAFTQSSHQDSRAVFSQDNQRLLLTERSPAPARHRVLRVWDVRKGLVLDHHFPPSSGVYVSPNGRYIVECAPTTSRRSYNDALNIYELLQESDGGLVLKRTQQYTFPFNIDFGEEMNMIFSADSKRLSTIYMDRITVFDLEHQQCIQRTSDDRIRNHKLTHPFLINSQFMIWQREGDQEHFTSVPIWTFHHNEAEDDVDPDLDPWGNVVYMRDRDLGNVDSFSQYPNNYGFAVAAREEDDPEHPTTTLHQLTLLKFTKRQDDAFLLNADGQSKYMMEVKCVRTFRIPRKMDRLAEQHEIPRHRHRMAWFTDGYHLAYVLDRRIILFQVNPDATEDPINVAPKSESLPSRLVAKANQVIGEKVPKEMYIDWIQIAPTSRTLVMRLCLFPGHEITRIVSI